MAFSFHQRGSKARWCTISSPYASSDTSWIQRHTVEISLTTPKFLDHSNPIYCDLHRACDTVYRELHGQGIGTAVRHTATFTPEEEEKLWVSGVIFILTPKAFQRAVFFYIGKHFCIRGGEELRQLGPS